MDSESRNKIYVALLRGINVGGKNKIKMAELREALERIGLSQVKTYIQSGNVLFASPDDESSLRKRIEQEIAAVFGITLTVVLRTAEEMEHIVDDCPFSPELIAEAAATCVGESHYVALLPDAPPPSGIEKLAAANNGDDEYRIVGRDVYLLFRHSVRDAKLSANLQKLGVPATVRNWNTMNKLVEMAKELRE
ncbi:DUF1697 domain-containing protein [Brevibacillus choshinensis]|uniref:DUF1697 domain-containing protein n=1 Tax=Brevibacillus choshinensis TaxID=54911 RepID=UPI001EEEFE79|nr:DUF1697 domain-containing protein [Brevibacillus choshinensis]